MIEIIQLIALCAFGSFALVFVFAVGWKIFESAIYWGVFSMASVFFMIWLSMVVFVGCAFILKIKGLE